jgi:hypothetical protein
MLQGEKMEFIAGYEVAGGAAGCDGEQSFVYVAERLFFGMRI